MTAAFAVRLSTFLTLEFPTYAPLEATRNKCIASSKKCLTSSNKKLLEVITRDPQVSLSLQAAGIPDSSKASRGGAVVFGNPSNTTTHTAVQNEIPLDP